MLSEEKDVVSWALLAFVSSTPLRVESRSVVERFLRPHSGSRKPRVKIGALNGLLLRQPLAKKASEAANKSVAGSGAIHALHAKSGHVLHALTSGKQRAIRTQRNDHPPHAAGKPLARAEPGIVEVPHEHARNCLCL